MHTQKESRVVTFIAVFGLFVVFSLLAFNDDLVKVGDIVFLYNRAFQIRDCLQHGVYPFLYYEDLGGIGYGTPIFYGQLTLFPFIFFVDDIAVFTKLYFLACLVLNFFAFRAFIKRISSYGTLMACFYIFSSVFIALYTGNLPANVMAVGWSWLFFAYCIDYFRDGRNLGLCALTYFMIWQSNFNSTVLSTLVCFGIFCVYFKRSELKRYALLLGVVLLTIGYNIVNIFTHLDAIYSVPADVMMSVFNGSSDIRVMSPFPIGGFMFRSLLEVVDMCTGIMSIGLFVIFVYYFSRNIRQESTRFRVCSLVIILLTAVGHIIGLYSVWPIVYQATNVFFQFPIRYYIYLFGFVLAILSRVIKPRWFVYAVLAFSIVDIFIVNPFLSDTTMQLEYIGLQLGNGEYASPDFIQDYDIYMDYSTSVHSESGADYSFTHEYNLVEVDCSSNPGVDVLTLPKLYYNGYVAKGENGERFLVSSGYSNYCLVDIGDYSGKLSLYYEAPNTVMMFFFIQVFVVGFLVFDLLRSTVWRKFLLWRQKENNVVVG